MMEAKGLNSIIEVGLPNQFAKEAIHNKVIKL
jgi:hypothetical protein